MSASVRTALMSGRCFRISYLVGILSLQEPEAHLARNVDLRQADQRLVPVQEVHRLIQASAPGFHVGSNGRRQT
ncbi:hypothetical protein MicloDRAFT_00034410 [Microvirga lotononidis]|uniref:Uncharacterized protein n=1 Tax=Microvirga lotononidis TaxID=864069 RepID=I4YSE8_9HYPH|nr:hypothetical protein MicloDRAFT_00034410 [Microvirga lotononidis]